MKFYITGGSETEDGEPRNDHKVPALVCYGADKVDALIRSGVTVWTEEEFKDFKECRRCEREHGSRDPAMNKPGLDVRIYRYRDTDMDMDDDIVPVYKVQDGSYRLKFVNSPQAAFDYCAETYPGEKVAVDIRP